MVKIYIRPASAMTGGIYDAASQEQARLYRFPNGSKESPLLAAIHGTG
jgi:hypothetical protein